jgi:hypothetical protein
MTRILNDSRDLPENLNRKAGRKWQKKETKSLECEDFMGQLMI